MHAVLGCSRKGLLILKYFTCQFTIELLCGELYGKVAGDDIYLQIVTKIHEKSCKDFLILHFFLCFYTTTTFRSYFSYIPSVRSDRNTHTHVSLSLFSKHSLPISLSFSLFPLFYYYSLIFLSTLFFFFLSLLFLFKHKSTYRENRLCIQMLTPIYILSFGLFSICICSFLYLSLIVVGNA